MVSVVSIFPTLFFLDFSESGTKKVSRVSVVSVVSIVPTLFFSMSLSLEAMR